MTIKTNSIDEKFLLKIAKIDIKEVFLLLKSSNEGISDKEAKKRIQKYGLNEIAHEKPVTWYKQLFEAITNPFNILLLILATISFITNDMKTAIVLSLMVLLSTTLRFYQEFRSSKAAEKLKALVSTKANIIRNDPNKVITIEHQDKESVLANIKEVPIKYLVPGDIIHLSAGDMIPADVRLIHAKDLFVSQATLTGEAFPLEKTSTEFESTNNNPLELNNICFMGSNIVSGSATAIVVNTSKNTYLGSLSHSILDNREETDFEKGINKFSWLLIWFMIFMVPSVFLINGLIKGNWMESLLFSIAVAVGLTPEMLPMIVTGNLAKGAISMSNKKVIVKRLNAIQNFGAMDVLCTDKTGTLTQDKVILLNHLDIEGNDSQDVLEHAYLNSHYQTGLKNLLDIAILSSKELVKILKITTNYHLIDEIPFDFVRRRMSVVIDELQDHHELICKGAVEEIYSICKYLKLKGEILPLDNIILEKITKLSKSLNEDGLRVIAIAYKELAPTKT